MKIGLSYKHELQHLLSLTSLNIAHRYALIKIINNCCTNNISGVSNRSSVDLIQQFLHLHYPICPII